TNYPYSQYRQRCMEVGADFFFDKHTEFNELFKVVKKFIKEFKTQRSLSTFEIKQNEPRSKNLSEIIDN
ncbi:MAG: hypothetical protein MUP98_06135, partial [Candidatus Aminicenantes bacterium]|nr:hypothetical protein [Candidatus Aminicenantes bacterium]